MKFATFLVTSLLCWSPQAFSEDICSALLQANIVVDSKVIERIVDAGLKDAIGNNNYSRLKQTLNEIKPLIELDKNSAQPLSKTKEKILHALLFVEFKLGGQFNNSLSAYSSMFAQMTKEQMLSFTANLLTSLGYVSHVIEGDYTHIEARYLGSRFGFQSIEDANIRGNSLARAIHYEWSLSH